MKKLVSIFFAMIISVPALALSEKELVAKTITNDKFMSDVENAIKNIFNEPNKVVVKFSSMGVEQAKAPKFFVEFEYSVQAGKVDMGYCTFLVLGEIKADSSVEFKKIVREDCGS